MDIVNVFVNDNGEFGNPVGIVIDEGKQISNKYRQKRAIQSGLSEIVFVNDIEANNISIFSPTREIPFAGHAVIGTAFYLDNIKKAEIDVIRSMDTEITVTHDSESIWVKAELANMPEWNFKQFEGSEQVESLLLKDTEDYEHCVVWSWTNERNGTIRARTFAPDWLIPEDEANGSGSLILATTLGREINITHGKGSIIFARPNDSKYGEVGGKVSKNNI